MVIWGFEAHAKEESNQSKPKIKTNIFIQEGPKNQLQMDPPKKIHLFRGEITLGNPFMFGGRKTHVTPAKGAHLFLRWVCGLDLMYPIDTIDGWNPANQLRLVVYPIIYDEF